MDVNAIIENAEKIIIKLVNDIYDDCLDKVKRGDFEWRRDEAIKKIQELKND